MRIFLTGGSGMVGRTLSAGLVAAGHDVTAPSSSQLNLLDSGAVSDAIHRLSPECVIHAAGRVGGIQANINEPVAFLHENMMMGMNVVQASAAAEIPALINLGSSCMYPREAENPLVETSILSGPLEPTNEGYALAKIATAKLAEYVRRSQGLDYVTVIPCNLYGPFDKFGDGAHMIPAAIKKVHTAIETGSEEVEIWGNGTARREFMYSGDLVDFIVRVVEEPTTCPDLVNVGLGWDLTINEYYAAIGEVLGYRGEFVHDLSKPTGMQQKLVDVSKSREMGWQSGTELRQGLQKTYDYYLEVSR